jgi:hypothetical protein
MRPERPVQRPERQGTDETVCPHQMHKQPAEFLTVGNPVGLDLKAVIAGDPFLVGHRLAQHDRVYGRPPAIRLQLQYVRRSGTSAAGQGEVLMEFVLLNSLLPAYAGVRWLRTRLLCIGGEQLNY